MRDLATADWPDARRFHGDHGHSSTVQRRELDLKRPAVVICVNDCVYVASVEALGGHDGGEDHCGFASLAPARVDDPTFQGEITNRNAPNISGDRSDTLSPVWGTTTATAPAWSCMTSH